MRKRCVSTITLEDTYEENLVKESLKMGLRINSAKTKVMHINNTSKEDYINRKSRSWRIEKFQYFGNIISDSGGVEKDMSCKINKAKKGTFTQLTHNFWDWNFLWYNEFGRLNFLLQVIRFNNVSNRRGRCDIDKFAPLREIFDIFVHNCEQSFSPCCSTTVYELLVAFRGKCLFSQYIKSKHAKYGIKIFTLTDARMFYVKINGSLCWDTTSRKPICVNKAHDVLRLVRTIEGTGRNITVDVGSIAFLWCTSWLANN